VVFHQGTNELARAISFFNKFEVIIEGAYGWEIKYKKLLEYLKRYPEFEKPPKEELIEYLSSDCLAKDYIVR
jgi:uncharacterized protein YktA (UPF0223 family)